MSHYRDPLAGLRSQIATKRGLVETRERALTPLLRAMLPRPLGTQLRELRAATDGEAGSFEAMTTVDAKLDELLSAHEQAARLVPKLRECPDEVPDPPKPSLSPPWAIEERPQIALRLLLARRLEELAPEAWLVRWDDTTYLARLRLAGAPLVLSCRFDLTPGQPSTFRSRVRTSVPDSTPALEVRPEGLFDGLGRLIGAVRDVETGDAALDDAFVVDAREAATALLSRDVREGILSLDELKPRLSVRRGLVELRWGGGVRGSPGPLWPDAALAVVLGIRAVVERD